MATIDNHPVTESTKLIVLGHSGSGKTGALASLAAVGYKLYILDLESGSDILPTLVRDKYKNIDPKNIDIIRITNTFKAFGDKLIPDTGGWQKVAEALAYWE